MHIVYTVLYFIVVTPAGYIYRLVGGDALRLKKKDTKSAFVTRMHQFDKADFESA